MTDAYYDDTLESDPRIRRPNVDVNAIRSSRVYRNARAEYRRECAVRRAPCIVCAEPINYGLKYPNPYSWSLEHLKALKHHPELALDRRNWGSSHLTCNRWKASEEFPEVENELGVASEEW